jgi:prepilin-type N-terminal cleavage/methylation domain-containing protein
MMTKARKGRAGFTLVELMISTVVLAILLDAVINGALMITKGATFGDKRARLASKVAMAVDRMTAEISMSSATGTDPATGQPYMAVTGVENAEILTFRRVVDFGNNGAELTPIWSTAIVYEIQNGAITRTQDGLTTVICSGATQLGFELQPTGRVLLTVAATCDPDRVAPDTLIQEVPVPTSF